MNVLWRNTPFKSGNINKTIMTDEKQDLRVVRTKEAIREAFKSLVCELPYEKVTVKAIADRARINRNTFYLHYETTDDVLREIQAEHSAEYIGRVKNLTYTENQGELVRNFTASGSPTGARFRWTR